MNNNILEGSTDKFGGKLKKTVGGLIGDKSLQTEGVVDQFSGSIQKAAGDAIDAVEEGIRPLVEKIRQFSRDRPFTTIAVAGVLSIALINTLRGK